MNPTRIVCIGNRHVDGDSAGFEVWKRLAGAPLPDGVDLVDGGVGGLDLLRFVEGAGRVVFVDAVEGFGRPGEALRISADEVASLAGDCFGHGAGLPFLLKALPLACEPPLPEVVVIGLEGRVAPDAVRVAARMALDAAVETSLVPAGGDA